jgi:hypothetical protein
MRKEGMRRRQKVELKVLRFTRSKRRRESRTRTCCEEGCEMKDIPGWPGKININFLQLGKTL